MGLILIGLMTAGLAALDRPGPVQPAGDRQAGGAVPPSPEVARMVQALGSVEAHQRAAAFKTMRECGGVGGQTYASLLESARLMHRQRLEQFVTHGLDHVHPFAEAEAKWRECREATMKNLMTDWHKEPLEIARLTNAFQDTERLLKALERHLRTPADVSDELVPVTKALREIEIEQSWCNVPRTAANGRSRWAYLGEVAGGDTLQDALKRSQDRSAAAAALEHLAELHKKKTRWAGTPIVEFAATLNWRRHVMGLAPLRLDERLSVATAGHSKEMRDRGYFAHESPVEQNKNPALRAANAAFEGRWSGENIYMGSASPEAAFESWWGSDGHRFIMFQPEANTLGLGVSGGYWTLNTGRKEWGAD